MFLPQRRKETAEVYQAKRYGCFLYVFPLRSLRLCGKMY